MSSDELIKGYQRAKGRYVLVDEDESSRLRPASTRTIDVRDALDGRAAVGRVAVHGREYLAAVVREDRALLMLTLRTKGEMRSADQVAAGRSGARGKARQGNVVDLMSALRESLADSKRHQ